MIHVISAHIYANSAPYFTQAVVCVTERDWSMVFTDSARRTGEMIPHKSRSTSISCKRVRWALELLANPSCGSQERATRHVINLDSFQQSATDPSLHGPWDLTRERRGQIASQHSALGLGEERERWLITLYPNLTKLIHQGLSFIWKCMLTMSWLVMESLLEVSNRWL